MVVGNFWALIQKYGGLGDGWDGALVIKIWCIISVVLVSGSHCSGRLGVAKEYGKLDFSGDVSFRGCNARFDSGYMLCVSTLVALDVFHTFSTLKRTRILKCSSPVFCRTEKRAQSMLLDAVFLCAARTWKPESPRLRDSRGCDA